MPEQSHFTGCNKMDEAITINCTTGETSVENIPPVPLPEAKAQKWQETKVGRSAKETGGCQTPFGRVQTDAASIAKINGLTTLALIAKGAGAPFSVEFTMEDNSLTVLDADMAIGLGVTVGQFVAAVYACANDKRALIESADSQAGLDSIDLQAGWPS